MAKLIDFEASLQNLLRTVFSQAVALKARAGADGTAAIDTIYGIYSGSSQVRSYDAVRDRGELVLFLSKLDEIRKKSGKRLHVQHCKADFAEIVAHYVRGHGTGVGLPPPEDLWDTFYHFLSQAFSPAAVKKRIYIHAARPVEINSIKIMRVLVGLLDKSGYQGFQEVKVAGPGSADRLDTIVAYLENDAVVEKVVGQIGTIPAGCFAAGVPKVVKVKRPGVGVADEPADVQLVGKVILPKGADQKKFVNPDKQSFGLFLSKLVWWALAETKNLTTMDELLKYFLIALEVAEIDPKNPHLHPHRAGLEQLQQAAFQAMARRRGRRHSL